MALLVKRCERVAEVQLQIGEIGQQAERHGSNPEQVGP